MLHLVRVGVRGRVRVRVGVRVRARARARVKVRVKVRVRVRARARAKAACKRRSTSGSALLLSLTFCTLASPARRPASAISACRSLERMVARSYWMPLEITSVAWRGRALGVGFEGVGVRVSSQ